MYQIRLRWFSWLPRRDHGDGSSPADGTRRTMRGIVISLLLGCGLWAAIIWLGVHFLG